MDHVSCLQGDHLINCGCVIRKFPGPIVPKTIELGKSGAQPYCIRTASFGPNYKSESLDSISKRASKTPANVLEPHEPSMDSLSMEYPDDILVFLTFPKYRFPLGKRVKEQNCHYADNFHLTYPPPIFMSFWWII